MILCNLRLFKKSFFEDELWVVFWRVKKMVGKEKVKVGRKNSVKVMRREKRVKESSVGGDMDFY